MFPQLWEFLLSLTALPPFQFVFPLLFLPVMVWLAYVGGLKGSGVSDDISPPGGILLYDGKWQKPISWHNVFKKFRHHFGLKPNPNRKWKEDKQPSHVPNPVANLLLNIWIFCGFVVSLFLFLRQLMPESLAFLSTLLPQA